MKLKRSSEVQSSRAAGLLVCAGLVAGMWGGALGCTSYSTLKAPVIDCTSDSAYSFLTVDTYDMAGASTSWYSAADNTTTELPTVGVENMPDGPRCNSSAALVLRSTHHNDWGSLFGLAGFGPRDASAYDGVAFWARAPGNRTKGFTVLLDDLNTNNLLTPPTCGVDAGTTAGPVDSGMGEMCKNYCTFDGGTGSPQQTVDPMTGMVIGGATTAAPPPDACGNDYSAVQVVSSDWRFYTIPFEKFQQAYMPNRVPNASLKITGSVVGNGLRTAALTLLVIRFPKEADAELWIDNLSFYRTKTAGSDGGSDAR